MAFQKGAGRVFMKVYTKTGDKGKTSLIGGVKVAKTHPRLHAYGTVDELNSLLGLLICEIEEIPELHSLVHQIHRIQNELFNLGSILACANKKLLKNLPQIKPEHTSALEAEIDEMTESLAPLKQFILPGGSRAAAYFHLGRTICRRAERHTTSLIAKNPELLPCMIYLNRLSDYLFVGARFANHKLKINDRVWAK